VEVTPPVSRYEQVAQQLRKSILDGTYPPGSKLPSGPELARQSGLSQHSAQRALELLEREGLVSIVSGSGTTVVAQRRWQVSVTVRWRDGGAVPREARDRGQAALSAAAQPDLAVPEFSAGVTLLPSVFDGSGGGWALVTEATVLAADFPLATRRLWDLVRESLRGHDGWDLDEPWASARPA
jgi:DNA-binding transcriptional MocR family regulator